MQNLGWIATHLKELVRIEGQIPIGFSLADRTSQEPGHSPGLVIESAEAVVLRDELVRIDGMPLVCRAIGMPAVVPGERVRVTFGEIDLWEANVLARYAGK